MLLNILSILLLIFFPSTANASGGGPLLLIFNASVFIIGQVWIVFVEYLIYMRFISLPAKTALKDIVVINIFSTISIAFIVPAAIAAVGVAGSFLPADIGKISAAFGTWVCDGCEYNRLALIAAFSWFLVLFILTVYFEAWMLKKRWKKDELNQQVSILKLSWYANSVSYLGLLIGILVIWSELI